MVLDVDVLAPLVIHWVFCLIETSCWSNTVHSVISILKDELACFLMTHDLCGGTRSCVIWIFVVNKLHSDALDGGVVQLFISAGDKVR